MLVSILGDSISTFSNCNPPGYAVYFDEYGSMMNGLRSVEDTWWAQTLDGLGAQLLMNDSFSGSLVCGQDFPAGCSVARTHNLGRDGKDPDLVLFFIGINDFGYCAPVGDIGTAAQALNFAGAYRLMLQRVHEFYPQAQLACSTLMRTAVKGYDEWMYPDYNQLGVSLDEFNQAIRGAAESEGAHLLDFAKRDVRYETLDGVHPTLAGHATIAAAWLEDLGKLLKE